MVAVRGGTIPTLAGYIFFSPSLEPACVLRPSATCIYLLPVAAAARDLGAVPDGRSFKRKEKNDFRPEGLVKKSTPRSAEHFIEYLVEEEM